MQEEVTQRTVALCVEATKLSAGMLQQAMKKVLDEMQKGVTGHKTKLHHGKQTLRQLIHCLPRCGDSGNAGQGLYRHQGSLERTGRSRAFRTGTAGLLRTQSALCESAACPSGTVFRPTDGRKSDPHTVGKATL